jgi:four helix bundle protein
MELFLLCYNLLNKKEHIDRNVKSHLLNSAQSIGSNIAEGYCRKSVHQYLHFLNIASGSSGELLTRMIGLKEIGHISSVEFDEFDKKHSEVENKLMNLNKSLQNLTSDRWKDESREPYMEYLENL